MFYRKRGIPPQFVYTLYYIRSHRKRKPPSRPLRRIWTNGQPGGLWGGIPVQNVKEPLRKNRSGFSQSIYFWKVTPDTVTLTLPTSNPLVFITAF